MDWFQDHTPFLGYADNHRKFVSVECRGKSTFSFFDIFWESPKKTMPVGQTPFQCLFILFVPSFAIGFEVVQERFF